MIKEIEAKTLVARVKGLDTYFGLDYGMNLYRGCQHHCIYCDSRSLCYEIEDFDGDVLIKGNAVERLRDELPRKRKRGIIGTGSMNDPYMPLEREIELTRRALGAIADYGFGVHVTTKSDLVLRDLDLLKRINRTHRAIVSMTVTTIDDDLARTVEPGAPPSSARLRALRRVSDAGIEARISLMPILPFIEDNWENVGAILEQARRCGVRAVVPWFGMSMRDRQRSHFYSRLDEHFPGIRSRYEESYGQNYMCPSPNAKALFSKFSEWCERNGIATSVEPHLTPQEEQLPLFGEDEAET